MDETEILFTAIFGVIFFIAIGMEWWRQTHDDWWDDDFWRGDDDD